MIEKSVYAIVEANVDLITDSMTDCNVEFEFVVEQVRAMPGMFGVVLKGLTLGFAVMSGLSFRNRVSRKQLIGKLNRTRWPVLRELAGFYQGLTVLVHYQDLGLTSDQERRGD